MSDRCTNAPYVEIWTCPNCYHDHDCEVDECASCKVALTCTTEHPPIAVCTIAGRDDDEDDQP